jgi:predicted RNA-binding protein with PIN domain
MPYLIDGHNLIAHVPDIALSDPDDEGKLVVRLRGFAAARRKQCIVVFDHGLPGGKSPMSNDTVKVIFATAYHSTADRILMERIRNTPDAGNWTVVTSDNEILAAAREKGMKGMKSADFVALMPDPQAKPDDPGEAIHPHISAQHVETMMDAFKTEMPQTPIQPSPPAVPKPTSYSETNPPAAQSKPVPAAPKTPRAPLSKPPIPATPPSSLMDKFDEVSLSDSEIESWLSVFDSQPPVAPTPAVPKVTLQPALPEDVIEEEPAPLPPPHKAGGQTDVRKMKVDDWMTYFGVDDTPPPPPAKPTDLETIRARLVEHDRSVDPNNIPREDMETWLRAFGVADKDAEDEPPTDNKPRKKRK